MSVHISGEDATVEFAGAVGAGLYRINAVVPEIAEGDHIVNVDVGGRFAQNFVYLPVGTGHAR